MGVAVLNPQDCLHNPFPSRQSLISPPRRPKPTRNPHATRSNRKKRTASAKNSPSHDAAEATPNPTAKTLVMGQVKILKRGEHLSEVPKDEPLKSTVPDLGSVERLGPDPDAVPTRIRLAEPILNGFYAGSGFVVSPPPSSLPLPAFFMKKSYVKKDDATSDLCRLLGLQI